MTITIMTSRRKQLLKKAEEIEKLNRRIERLTEEISDAIIYNDVNGRIFRETEKREAIRLRELALQELKEL